MSQQSLGIVKENEDGQVDLEPAAFVTLVNHLVKVA